MDIATKKLYCVSRFCSRLHLQRYLYAPAKVRSLKTASEGHRRRSKLPPISSAKLGDVAEGRSKTGTRRSRRPPKPTSKKGRVELKEEVTSTSELGKRRRAPEPIVWSAVSAETMLLYKDDDILALNKPAGLAVHGGPRLHDDLSQHLSLWQYTAPSAPELAHRLDKDTSGVLLLTRHAESAKRIAKLFHDRKIIKKYWAITVNIPESLEGSIRIPIGTKNISEKRRGSHSMNRVVLRRDLLEDESLSSSHLSRGSLVTATNTAGVHMAQTDYKVLSLSSVAPRRSCLILLQPVTGFKHQLRVHMADGLVCPVLGDYKFGGPLFRLHESLRRKMKAMEYVRGYFYLHAAQLEIPNYSGRKGKSLVITAPPPPHFVQTAKMLGLLLPRESF